MLFLRMQAVLIAAIALVTLAACASQSGGKGHLTSAEVQSLMDKNSVQTFDVSRVGGSVIVLDSGDIFTADLPPIEKIHQYLERRDALGKPTTFIIE